MVAPTVVSVTPNVGLSIGRTFVKIVGTNFNLAAVGSVKVLFDGAEADDVGVISTTELYCLTPFGDPDSAPVDVEVVNVTGMVEESATLAGGFTFQRPVIDTKPNNRSPILVAIRAIIRDFRQFVLKETYHDVHSEYSGLIDAAFRQEKQARLPHIKIVGPMVTEDRFYSQTGSRIVATPSGYDEYEDLFSARLDFDYVGVANSKGEAVQLLSAVMRYFKRTGFIRLEANCVDDTDGYALYEISNDQDSMADFKVDRTRDNVYQFTGGFNIRGVPVNLDLIGEGRDIDECFLDIEQIQD